VRELLRAERRQVQEVAILGEARGPALQELLGLARSRGVKVSYRTREQLAALAGSPDHQGVVARVAPARYASLGEVLERPALRGEIAFFLALDRVQDPRNLGAILRTAEATGVHGVLIPTHHAVGLTGAVAKSAMGALEFVPVAREANLVSAIGALKRAGAWIVGAAAGAGPAPWEADLSGPICLALGGEGKGLRPLVAQTCDRLVSLPMLGRLPSLNVAAAAAALCYEVVRQRAAGASKKP
jgi:23S rRNA (guanosine2251-2'-O)-methyltransferase